MLRTRPVSWLAIFLLAVLLNSYVNLGPRRRLESLPSSELTALYKADGRQHVSRDYRLSYVHIPKTGGSTVEYSSLFHEKRRYGGLRPSSHYSVRQLRKSAPNFTVATHVRNPCDRFVSAFRYVRYDKRSKGLRPYVDKFGLSNLTSVTELVEWLDETPERWRKLKRQIVHFRDMLSWVLNDDETFGVDVVMCQENWNEGVKRLLEQLDSSSIPKDLYDRRLASRNHQGCRDLPVSVQDRIFDVYALDSCVFGYGRFGLDEFAIPERVDPTGCIGAQFNQTWFTERYRFCRTKLNTTIENLLL